MNTPTGEPCWRVSWKAKLDGRRGHGEYRLSREEAEAQAERPNGKFPELCHWAESKPCWS